jgi:hypothetical protein
MFIQVVEAFNHKLNAVITKIRVVLCVYLSGIEYKHREYPFAAAAAAFRYQAIKRQVIVDAKVSAKQKDVYLCHQFYIYIVDIISMSFFIFLIKIDCRPIVMKTK